MSIAKEFLLRARLYTHGKVENNWSSKAIVGKLRLK